MMRIQHATVILLLVLTLCAGQVLAKTYYVSTTGNDSANGLTEATAWRTITRAANVTVAGDTVKIKAGKYNNEHAVISNRTGTKASPIVFEGYGGTPELDGLDGTGNGIAVSSSTYVELKNLKVTRYRYGVPLTNATYVTLDGITATILGNRTGSYDGWGIRLDASHHCIVRNCNVTDAGAINFHVWKSNYNLIENCTSYGIAVDDATDYYMVVQYSHDNIIKDCTAENKHTWSTAHTGHGIGFKYNNYNNKVINCVTRGLGEHLYVAHYSHHNEFIDCTAYNGDLIPYHKWNHGLRIRDGSYSNTFKNCKAIGVRSGACFGDTAETPEVTIQSDNVFLNCVFDVTDAGMYFINAKNNVFKNCVITGAARLFGDSESGGGGNTLTDSIITNIYYRLGTTGVSITYSDFWNNNFSTPSGTGNTSKDPLFANPIGGDYHLKSKAGRWDPANKVFVKDTVTSPCIDAGDANSEYKNEPIPNGGRINMGAYGNTAEASKTESAATPSQVKGRLVFYNNSSFDGDNAGANADDDGAIAPDKTALLPGGTATFANYTSYSRGINGIMVDIANLPGTPTKSDFALKVGNDNNPAAWTTASAPAGVTVRKGAGVGGSDRITLIWADNAIQKQWLQVTVKATAATGLTSADVFYFGNVIGETGNSTADAKVNYTDETDARGHPHSFGGLEGPAGIDDAYDFNRDKKVGPTDEIIARSNGTNSTTALKLITVPEGDGSTETIAWSRPIWVVHGGGDYDGPENTIAALKKSVALGAKYAEIDLRVTKDNLIVAIHDETIDRTTNGTGRVDALTYAQIKLYDAGSWFQAEFVGERVPLLSDVLEFARINDMKLLLHVKVPEVCPLLFSLLEKHGMVDDARIYMKAATTDVRAALDPRVKQYPESLIQPWGYKIDAQIVVDTLKNEAVGGALMRSYTCVLEALRLGIITE